MKSTIIEVKTIVNAPIEKVWKHWTTPEDICKWNNASPEWHTPKAENNLKIGGKFNYRMEAKDESMGFDFWGIYDEIILNKFITYTTGDNRKVSISFSTKENKTIIFESFEAENTNSIELQRDGWQNIFDNFRKYTNSNN